MNLFNGSGKYFPLKNDHRQLFKSYTKILSLGGWPSVLNDQNQSNIETDQTS